MKDIYYAVAHRSQEEIDSFTTRYQDFRTDLIGELFNNALGLTVTGFRPSTSWGTAHVIYFVTVKEKNEPLILRANLGKSDPEIVMLVEKLVTDKLKAFGVPTNRLLYVDVTRQKYPFDFQIQDVLPGQDLESSFVGSKEKYDRMSYELGSIVARYHALTFDWFGRFSEDEALEGILTGSKATFYDYIITNVDDDIAYLVSAGVVTSQVGIKIRKLFDEYRPVINIARGSLIHHDLADHNIMFVGDNITGIFDWEACVVGDPALDLASCPTWKTFFPREEELLAGYQSVRPLPDHWEEKRKIYRLRTKLWKMVFVIRANLLTAEKTASFLETLALFGLSS